MCIRDRAYTITHHTRQSAVGLPFIRQRHYGDKDVSVTEYTMSEIIASKMCIRDRPYSSPLRYFLVFLPLLYTMSRTATAPTTPTHRSNAVSYTHLTLFHKVERSEKEGGAWDGSMISVWTTPPLRV